MKSKFYLSFMVAVCMGLSLFAVGSNAAHELTHKYEAKNTVTPKDNEIIGVLMVLNKNEIAVANAVLKKTSNPVIIKYARMLKKEHTKNLNKTLRISKKIGAMPIESAVSKKLQRHGEDELRVLSTLQGQPLDKKFISLMVKDHSDALHLIDTKLLKYVSNPMLKEQIIATRPHIAKHLEDAKQIQMSLK